jgi:saccharopine dehydrogenase-like NADP-dependent oxidoreductase
MTTKPRVAVLGTGKIGRLVAFLLADSGDYAVTALDADASSAEAAARDADGRPLTGATSAAVDFADPNGLAGALAGHDYAVSCAPYFVNVGIATAAAAAGAHYLDLTEDVATTRAVRRLADAGGGTAFIPQCGLAPGAITIVAGHLMEGFERLDAVRMRVGALPLHASNRLKYALTWSTDGLINEYGNPCEAVVGGRRIEVPPLEGLESLTIDGEPYEAFNTSGGLGTLADTLSGRVRELDYKTIRYPGHRDAIALLMNDLRLNDDRPTLRRILEHALPTTLEDVVLVMVTVTGWREGRLLQRSHARKHLHQQLGGRDWGAIQVTTAAGITAVLDLHAEGVLPRTGFVRQEDVPYAAFMANRFGRLYA